MLRHFKLKNLLLALAAVNIVLANGDCSGRVPALLENGNPAWCAVKESEAACLKLYTLKVNSRPRECVWKSSKQRCIVGNLCKTACAKIDAFGEGIISLGREGDCRLGSNLVAGTTCNVKCDESKGFSSGMGTYTCAGFGAPAVTSLECRAQKSVIMTTFTTTSSTVATTTTSSTTTGIVPTTSTTAKITTIITTTTAPTTKITTTTVTTTTQATIASAATTITATTSTTTAKSTFRFTTTTTTTSLNTILTTTAPKIFSTSVTTSRTIASTIAITTITTTTTTTASTVIATASIPSTVTIATATTTTTTFTNIVIPSSTTTTTTTASMSTVMITPQSIITAPLMMNQNSFATDSTTITTGISASLAKDGDRINTTKTTTFTNALKYSTPLKSLLITTEPEGIVAMYRATQSYQGNTLMYVFIGALILGVVISATILIAITCVACKKRHQNASDIAESGANSFVDAVFSSSPEDSINSNEKRIPVAVDDNSSMYCQSPLPQDEFFDDEPYLSGLIDVPGHVSLRSQQGPEMHTGTPSRNHQPKYSHPFSKFLPTRDFYTQPQQHSQQELSGHLPHESKHSHPFSQEFRTSSPHHPTHTSHPSPHHPTHISHPSPHHPTHTSHPSPHHPTHTSHHSPHHATHTSHPSPHHPTHTSHHSPHHPTHTSHPSPHHLTHISHPSLRHLTHPSHPFSQFLPPKYTSQQSGQAQHLQSFHNSQPSFANVEDTNGDSFVV